MIIINIPRRWRPLWALGACGTWWGAPLRALGATSGRHNAPPMCSESSLLTSTDSSNYESDEKTNKVIIHNYDLRRNDTTGQNFYIGNSNTNSSETSNFYMSGPNNNSAFSIGVTHRWGIIAPRCGAPAPKGSVPPCATGAQRP